MGRSPVCTLSEVPAFTCLVSLPSSSFSNFLKSPSKMRFSLSVSDTGRVSALPLGSNGMLALECLDAGLFSREEVLGYLAGMLLTKEDLSCS